MANKTYEDYEAEQLAQAKKQADAYAIERNTQARAAVNASDSVYNTAITTAEKNADAAVKSTESGYREVFDANAVDELVARREVEETLANMGLTDSGLNATQQTAISLQRGRADHQTTQQKQAAVDTIMRELDKVRAQYNAEKTVAAADIYAQADADILSLRTGADAAARENAATLYAAEQAYKNTETPSAEASTVRVNRSNAITWAKKLWDEEAFGTNDSTEARSGLAGYLYAQHAGNNIESGGAANQLYQLITGEKTDSALAAGFIALMPSRQDYEATYGAGTFDAYVCKQLTNAVAAGQLKETADIDAVIRHYGIVYCA